MPLIFEGILWETFGLVLLPCEELTFYKSYSPTVVILKPYHAVFRDVVTSSAALIFIVSQIMGNPHKIFLA